MSIPIVKVKKSPNSSFVVAGQTPPLPETVPVPQTVPTTEHLVQQTYAEQLQNTTPTNHFSSNILDTVLLYNVNIVFYHYNR